MWLRRHRRFGCSFEQVGSNVQGRFLSDKGRAGRASRPVAICALLLAFLTSCTTYGRVSTSTPPPDTVTVFSTVTVVSTTTLDPAPSSAPTTTRPAVTTTTTSAMPRSSLPAPAATPGVAGQTPIETIAPSAETLSRSYRWKYGLRQWTWDLFIPQSLYDYYRALPRIASHDYSVYVTHPSDDDIMSRLVAAINRAGEEGGFGEYEKVAFAVSFAQSLPYTVDSVTTPYDEYPRYPLETLADNGGDCEDTSILLASLLHAMGYDTVLIELPRHMGVGVLGADDMYGTYYRYLDRKYFYIETTGTGWDIGELPDEYKGAQARVFELKPAPILAHTWTTKASGNSLELEVVVENRGTAEAGDVYVLAGFDAGESMLWSKQESQHFDLGMGNQLTAKLLLQVPPDKHTRLLVQIVDDGYAVDESRSEWFDT